MDKITIDQSKLKRNKPIEVEEEKEPEPVAQGTIDKVVDYAFNATREKIREMTIVDRMQGRLLPQLDLINLVWQYVYEVAFYRQDSVNYEKVFKKKQPVLSNLIEEFTYRTAQWNKSVGGKNLERAIDIALAETEKDTDMGYGDASGGLDER